MEKIIKVNEKEVRLKSTAGTFTRYRNYFKRDLMKDFIRLQESLKSKKENGTNFDVLDLEMFERIAWCMAKTADNNIPDIEHWLDEFETFDIMYILPQIMTLLTDNMAQISNVKKNIPKAKKSK